MAASGGPRIAPGDRRQLGWVNFGIAKLAGVATRGRPPHIFTTLGRHRGLFRRWLWFAGALMPGGKLPREETELVILRVAHNTGSDLRVGAARAHGAARRPQRRGDRPRPPGPRRGRLDASAAPCCCGPPTSCTRATGSAMSSGQQLSHHLDEVLLIELCMLIGHYEMLAMTLNSLEVEPDFEARL